MTYITTCHRNGAVPESLLRYQHNTLLSYKRSVYIHVGLLSSLTFPLFSLVSNYQIKAENILRVSFAKCFYGLGLSSSRHILICRDTVRL